MPDETRRPTLNSQAEMRGRGLSCLQEKSEVVSPPKRYSSLVIWFGQRHGVSPTCCVASPIRMDTQMERHDGLRSCSCVCATIVDGRERFSGCRWSHPECGRRWLRFGIGLEIGPFLFCFRCLTYFLFTDMPHLPHSQKKEELSGSEGWGPKGWEARNFVLFFPLPLPFFSVCLSLGVFSWNFGGVV